MGNAELAESHADRLRLSLELEEKKQADLSLIEDRIKGARAKDAQFSTKLTELTSARRDCAAGLAGHELNLKQLDLELSGAEKDLDLLTHSSSLRLGTSGKTLSFERD